MSAVAPEQRAVPETPALPGALSQLVQVLRKDLLIEWRGRARVLAMAMYAVLMILLFSFTVGPDTKALQLHAAGYLWIAVLSASTLLLSQSFLIETEGGALEGMVLLPVDPRALFFGKAIANTLVLTGLALLSIPVCVFLFDLGFRGQPATLLPIVILGAAGVAAPGTLYAGLTARLQSRQLMLPLLLFPLLIPALVGAVKATQLVIQGDPMDQQDSWMGLLICFDAVYWAMGGVLFPRLVEE